jgi:hypothetical protein
MGDHPTEAIHRQDALACLPGADIRQTAHECDPLESQLLNVFATDAR